MVVASGLVRKRARRHMGQWLFTWSKGVMHEALGWQLLSCQGNPARPPSLNIAYDWHNATTAKRLAVKYSSARAPKVTQNALWKNTNIATVTTVNTFHAEDHANHIAWIIGRFTQHIINRTLWIIYLNVRKQGAVYKILIVNKDTQSLVALVIQEP